MERTYSRYIKGENQTIEDLQGAFESCCNCGEPTDEQKVNLVKQQAIYVLFNETLTEQQQDFERQLSELRGEEMAIISSQSFMQGFKIATRLLLEAMK